MQFIAGNNAGYTSDFNKPCYCATPGTGQDI